jgi:hypothetical protein
MPVLVRVLRYSGPARQQQAHNKDPALVVAEVDRLCGCGVQEILLACDNFIGDPRWAEAVVDHLLAWQAKSGHRPSLYTWLTINLFKHDRLMRKMRSAGFDMLFIGVESFTTRSLLETAKLQNTASDLVGAVRHIQSFGFIVVAGLIFGFDSDESGSFDITLNGLSEAGLLSGDPSLLTALPGTPLYQRMKLSGRLRDVRYGLGGFKYQTNIRYLMPRDVLVRGFKSFITVYCRGDYQLRRLRSFLSLLERGNFIPLRGKGYGRIGLLVGLLARDRRALRLMVRRFGLFVREPGRVYAAAFGFLAIAAKWRVKGRFRYYSFWLFAWSNAVLKYGNVAESDFDVESVDPTYDVRRILPLEYNPENVSAPIPRHKVVAQINATSRHLKALVRQRLSAK